MNSGDTSAKGKSFQALDESKRREICAILAVGCSRRTAAKYVGCAVDTIRRTALRDPEFEECLRKAESQHEIIHLRNIQEAGGRYWRASAWVLERLYAARYAARPADGISREQLSQILAEFAQIVAEEIPTAKYRASVLKRLVDLTVNLRTAAEESDDE